MKKMMLIFSLSLVSFNGAVSADDFIDNRLGQLLRLEQSREKTRGVSWMPLSLFSKDQKKNYE